MTFLYGLIILGQDRSVPLRGVDVSVSVQGFLANVEASLQYSNTSTTDTLEVVYVFPMDDSSAVYKLEAHIDGRHIAAEVQEKQEARETYEEAVQSGRSAVLMEEHDTSGDIFRCKLGNLPPNSQADIKFSFVTELSLETDGSLKFVLPTVLNPRYNPSVEDGGSKEDTSFSTVQQSHYNLTFKGSVSSKHGISRVWSESDELRTSLETAAGNVNTMKFKLKGPPRLDHDISFQVLYENSRQPKTTLEKGDQDKEGLMRKDLLMLSFYPDLTSFPTSGAAEFIFVIDRSDSMYGRTMQSAKEAMLFFLKSLPVDCFFNIVNFGTFYKALFQEGSKRYEEGTLKAAMELQANLKANMGGTEILEALQFVFREKAKAGYPKQIFLLTDGGVSNAEEVVALVKRNSYNSRVFTVGIGDGVSTSLVRNVAKAGGGDAEFVTDSLNLQQKVMKLLKAACQPAATDIELDLDLPPGLSVDLMLPKDMPVIFSGRRCSMFVFLGGQADTSKGKAHLSGKISGTNFKYSMEFDMETDAQVTSGQFVHRMAMKGLIKDLEIEESGEKKREIILASTASNLISKYTSFVGVDKDKNEKITEAVTYYVAPPSRRDSAQHPKAKSAIHMYAVKQDFQSMGWEPRQMVTLGEPITRPPSPPPTPPPQLSLRRINISVRPKRKLRLKSRRRNTYASDEISLMSVGNQMKFSSKAGELVMLQTFDGSWEMDSYLPAIVQVTKDVLVKGTGIKDMKVLATCAAVCWLTLKCSEEWSVWGMVVDKAKQWLLRTVGDQKRVDKLMKEVTETFCLNCRNSTNIAL